MNRPPASWALRTGGVGRASAAVLLAVIAIAVLYRVDPTTSDWLPKCPLHRLTGWHCPGCGSTRAAHALLHGDVGSALAYNALLICAAPLAAIYWGWSRWRRGPQWATALSVRAILLVLAVLVAFAILRNVPAYPFNLLAPH
jgi:Protein of unknown function (DUF2752)